MEGTLIVPDPNRFGGQVELLKKGGESKPVDTDQPYADGNYRSLGLADLARAIRSNRPHRATGQLALHVLEAMEAFQSAAERGGRPGGFGAGRAACQLIIWERLPCVTRSSRWMSGAATNPDPDVFALCGRDGKDCAWTSTQAPEGENYVLWGGREGYETLLNTDLKRRAGAGTAASWQLVVDYKHKIGFKGAILIEPKPQEPTKHQYDYDVATVYGFLKRFGLESEVKVNIEQGHAILAGHSFEHELALANALGIFGSIDMNRNDYQSGWDTDQFPNNVPEMALAYYQVLAGGGLKTGGTNFDSKLRRQSLDPQDLLIGHIGAMDCCARGLKAAADDRRRCRGRWRSATPAGNRPRRRRCCQASARWRRSPRASSPRRSRRSRNPAARNIWRTSSTGMFSGRADGGGCCTPNDQLPRQKVSLDRRPWGSPALFDQTNGQVDEVVNGLPISRQVVVGPGSHCDIIEPADRNIVRH